MQENPMYYAGLVEEFYNSACPSYTRNGYEKNALIDRQTEACIFVPGDVTPSPTQLLFRCKRAQGKTIITLKSTKPKNESKKPGIRIYEAEIRLDVFDGKERRYAYPPEAIAYEPIKTVKLTNWDYFMECAMDLGEECLRPYLVLQQMEEQFNNNSARLAEACVLVPYAKEDDGVHYHIFYFSHFEMTGTGVCAVYEFAWTNDRLT